MKEKNKCLVNFSHDREAFSLTTLPVFNDSKNCFQEMKLQNCEKQKPFFHSIVNTQKPRPAQLSIKSTLHTHVYGHFFKSNLCTARWSRDFSTLRQCGVLKPTCLREALILMLVVKSDLWYIHTYIHSTLLAISLFSLSALMANNEALKSQISDINEQ